MNVYLLIFIKVHTNRHHYWNLEISSTARTLTRQNIIIYHNILFFSYSKVKHTNMTRRKKRNDK